MVKKLNRLQVEEKLKSLSIPVFTPREFRDIFAVSSKTASSFISTNLSSGLFIKLRNGYYMLKDSMPSLYTIANTLYKPSYISLEKALAHYGIIPEVVYAITSITTKPTREFTTPKGVFSYQRIKKAAFTGYSPVTMEGSLLLFAQPEKALADYLYFVDLKKTALNDRLNLASIAKSKLLSFARLFGRPSLGTLINRVYADQGKSPAIY